ncbi:MAG: hypothetical protein LKI45_05710 [Schleiferilactobacillus harbinensis]|jgi:hypothetical protein|nr:hypothetical protein [Schleiferilactobacillus harbinensis]
MMPDWLYYIKDYEAFEENLDRVRNYATEVDNDVFIDDASPEADATALNVALDVLDAQINRAKKAADGATSDGNVKGNVLHE